VSRHRKARSGFAAAVAAVVVAGPAFAPAAAFGHTTIESTVPRNYAVLAVSPAEIRVRFEHLAMLTSVIVVAPGHRERRLEFEPMTNALEFTLLDPALVPGRNEIRWKGLASDGHVIEGTLVFLIDPRTSAF
jgi:methionine-rich copper-binding protein CopC